jgi:hypothetical protein
MTDDKLALATARAARAKALLEDELIIEAFDTITRSYLDAWHSTGLDEQDKRERLWQAVRVTGEVKKHLKTVVSDGKLAQREIDDLARGRPKRFGLV